MPNRKSSTTRKRRIRRTSKQVLKHGKHAKRAHTRSAGRTGSVHSRKLQQPAKRTKKPNPFEQLLAAHARNMQAINAMMGSIARIQETLPRVLEGRRTFTGWQATIPAGGSYTFEYVGEEVVPFVVDRLLVVPSSAGLMIDSIRVRDEEHVVSSIPAEVYGTVGASLSEKFVFDNGASITVRNPTADDQKISIAVKGRLETDREFAERLKSMNAKLRRELTALKIEKQREAEIAAAARLEPEELQELRPIPFGGEPS